MRTAVLISVAVAMMGACAGEGGSDSDPGSVFCGPLADGVYEFDLRLQERVRGNCPTSLRGYPMTASSDGRNPTIYTADRCMAIIGGEFETWEVEQPREGKLTVTLEMHSPVCEATYVGAN